MLVMIGFSLVPILRLGFVCTSMSCNVKMLVLVRMALFRFKGVASSCTGTQRRIKVVVVGGYNTIFIRDAQLVVFCGGPGPKGASRIFFRVGWCCGVCARCDVGAIQLFAWVSCLVFVQEL